MEERKWIVLLSFIAVSIIVIGYYVSKAGFSLEGISLSSPLFWIIVTGLALADSINPCMISVMALMVATLASLGLEKRSILIRAIVFTISIFVTYLMLGILLFLGYSYVYGISKAAGAFNILKNFLVAILIAGGVINLKDAVFAREKATFAIPDKAKERLKSLMTYVSILTAILLGAFVTVVELPCTGIFYIGLIAYLHSVTKSLLTLLPVLIYYNLLFIAPEVVITLFVWKGIEPKKVTEWHRKHRRGMRVIEGATMIILGVIVYLFVRVG